MSETTPRPAAKAPPITLQGDWLKRNKGKVITVRLLDETRLSGLLIDWDTYTVAIRVQGREESVLLNKHAIALFMRREAEDKEKNGERPPPVQAGDAAE